MTSKEGPALGAAILAGVCAGVYPSVQEACRRVVRTKTEQLPDTANNEEYEKYYNIYRELYPALRDIYIDLANI